MKHDGRSRKPDTEETPSDAPTNPSQSIVPVAILAAITSHRLLATKGKWGNFRGFGKISRRRQVATPQNVEDRLPGCGTALQTVPVNRQRHRDFVAPIRLGSVEPRFDAPIAALTLRLGMTV